MFVRGFGMQVCLDVIVYKLDNCFPTYILFNWYGKQTHIFSQVKYEHLMLAVRSSSFQENNSSL